jgi:hypothetical protein
VIFLRRSSVLLVVDPCNTPTPSGQWQDLKVRITGAKVEGYVKCMALALGESRRFRPPRRVKGAAISGISTSVARQSASGRVVTFHFCTICGSTIYWEAASFPT